MIAANEREGLQRMTRSLIGVGLAMFLLAACLGSNAMAASGLSGAKAINDGAGPAPEAPAYPGTDAFWAGVCDLFSPATDVEALASPANRRDCIDEGVYPNPFGTSPNKGEWETPPSWRLRAIDQAGAHADATATFTVEPRPGNLAGVGVGAVRDISVDIPRGVVGNPSAVEKCSLEDFAKSPVQCSPQSQVGLSSIRLVEETNAGPTPLTSTYPVYNLQPRQGYIAEFGLADVAVHPLLVGVGTSVRVFARVRSEGDLGITTGLYLIPTAWPVAAQSFTVWATPWASSHDRYRPLRGSTLGDPDTCGRRDQFAASPTGLPPACQVSYHPSWGPIKPFFTLQTECGPTGPFTKLGIDSYQEPGRWLNPEDRLAFRIPDYSDPNWDVYEAPANPVVGCGDVPWAPSISLDPQEGKADSPTALDVSLRTPQNNDAPGALATNPNDETGAPAFFKSKAGLATSHLKDTIVKLPQGFSFNASAANGLDGCSTSEIGLTSAVGQLPATFNNKDVSCPESSKIGTLQVDTPLLDKPLPGFVYLADQDQNAFGTTYSIYLVIQDKDRNLIIKIPGTVEPDASTGQIVSRFLNNPQQPFETFQLHFKGGAGAPLATPTTCGTHSSESDLAGWARPNNPVHVSDPFEITSAPAGGCPTSDAQRPFDLGLSAGSSNNQAGAKSPFQIQITRPDGNQELDRLEISPPPGFVASLKGIPYCSEAAIAAASNRSGKAEQSNPSCPASEVGSSLVGAGAGSSPYYAPGKLYLAGPYKGQTLSVVAITPAVAGPYDLGTVVVRSALKIDPRTARITAVSDPLPQVFEGIPLRIRDVRINLDRPNWAINPTNCEPMSVDVTSFGSDGAQTKDTSRYQLSGCEKLGFKPNLQIKLIGGTKRGDHPALLATLKTRPGDANIARAAVTLPSSAFLDQAHIRTICTRVQYAADNCPKGAVYGSAKADTPLLDQPLQGDVILRSSDNKLPDLVGRLRGVANIEAVGRIDSVNGGIRNTFEIIPDAPFDVFTLRMQGANKGLVINSKDLCATTNRATVKFTAQNGRKYSYRPKVIATKCAKAKKAKRKGKAAR